MKRIVIKALVVAVAVAGGLIGTSSSADAAFRMRVETGTTTGPGVVITDGVNETGAAAGGAGQSDLIMFSGAIGQFVLNVTTGVSTPFMVAPTFFEAQDLNNITINSTGAGTLRIILAKDGYGAATPDGNVAFRSEVGGTLTAPAGSSITFSSYADDANVIPSLGGNVNPVGPLAAVTGIGGGSSVSVTQTFGVGAFSGSNGVNFFKTGTYSMYQVATVTFTGAGSVSWDHAIGTAPAPAGLILALTALPTLGLGAWVRRRKTTVAA
jgi:hypothetical protein